MLSLYEKKTLQGRSVGEQFFSEVVLRVNS